MPDKVFCGADEAGSFIYTRWRDWGGGFQRKQVVFLDFSPAVCGAPKLKMYEQLVRKWKLHGFVSMYIYAHKNVIPSRLKTIKGSIGPLNDIRLSQWGELAKYVVAVWSQAVEPKRLLEVYQAINRPIHCLARTVDGYPTLPVTSEVLAPTELLWSPSMNKPPRKKKATAGR